MTFVLTAASSPSTADAVALRMAMIAWTLGDGSWRAAWAAWSRNRSASLASPVRPPERARNVDCIASSAQVWAVSSALPLLPARAESGELAARYRALDDEFPRRARVAWTRPARRANQ
jgi:hypothetical protein